MKLLPILQQRWSPTEFDAQHTVTPDAVELLLEAARWAPSAGNSQPWAFHVARRDEPAWHDLVPHLAGSSRRWAPRASLLVVNLAHVYVAETDWEYSEFSAYDLGQAVAHMTIQAHGMGLACRQFRAFDKVALTEVLRVPPHWEVVTMTAIGKVAAGSARVAGADTREETIVWPRD